MASYYWREIVVHLELYQETASFKNEGLTENKVEWWYFIKKKQKEFVTKRFSFKLILKDLLQAKENNPIRKTLSAEGLMSKGNSKCGNAAKQSILFEIKMFCEAKTREDWNSDRESNSI